MEPFIYFITCLTSIKFKFISSRFVIMKLVSSTNKNGLNLSVTLFERSLTYIKNNNGPKMVIAIHKTMYGNKYKIHYMIQ